MPGRRTWALAAIGGLGAVLAAPGHAADLTVTVSGMRSQTGFVRMALYDAPEYFPKRKGMIGTADVPLNGGKVVHVFRGLAPGRYAVSLYHDENGNGKFDFTWIGLPDEGFGFSNGATAGLSAPDFDEAAVEVGEPATMIAIKLTYW